MPNRSKKPSEQSLTLSKLRGLKMQGLTSEQGGVMAQAGSVCLEEQGHGTVAPLKVQGEFNSAVSLRRLPVTDHLRHAYGFDTRATDNGACGIAILLIFHFTDLKVLWESKRTTGYDYWLGTDQEEAFAGGVMLEISGIRSGNSSAISQRVAEKVAQVTTAAGQAAGYIVVVEFSGPVARIVKL
jgi:hypothetical protein